MTKPWYNISQNDLKAINQPSELSAAIQLNSQIAPTSSLFYLGLLLCIIYLQSAVHVDTALQVHKRPPWGVQLHSRHTNMTFMAAAPRVNDGGAASGFFFPSWFYCTEVKHILNSGLWVNLFVWGSTWPYYLIGSSFPHRIAKLSLGTGTWAGCKFSTKLFFPLISSGRWCF